MEKAGTKVPFMGKELPSIPPDEKIENAK